jgi:hypothetical protein
VNDQTQIDPNLLAALQQQLGMTTQQPQGMATGMQMQPAPAPMPAQQAGGMQPNGYSIPVKVPGPMGGDVRVYINFPPSVPMPLAMQMAGQFGRLDVFQPRDNNGGGYGGGYGGGNGYGGGGNGGYNNRRGGGYGGRY